MALISLALERLKTLLKSSMHGSLFLIFYPIVVASSFLWFIVKIDYNHMGSFDILLFTDFRVVPVFLLSILIILIFSALQLRIRRGYYISASFTVALMIYVLLLYSMPFVVNAPYMLHRDVYLHNSYSAVIVESGRIPIDENRWDVYSFPGAFLFYAIHMAVTGLDFYSSGLAMTFIWPLLFTILLLFATRRLRGSDTCRGFSSLLALLLIPYTLARYAPTPSFFHRYHLAFSLTLIWFPLFLRSNGRPRKADFALLYLLYFAIVFTHPYFSVFIAVFLLIHIFVSVVIEKQARTIWIPLVAIIAGLILHIAYLASPRMIIEAYTTMIRPKLQFSEFVEQSLPVYTRAPAPILEYLALVERNIWRADVLGLAMLVSIDVLIGIIRLRTGALTKALPLMLSAAALSLPLVYSFLWWERPISILGLAVFLSALVISSSRSTLTSGSRLFRILLFVLILVGVIVAPLNRYERSILESLWRSPAESEALWFASSNMGLAKAYVGSSTGVVFTFYRLFVNPSLNVRTVFDAVRGRIMIDPKTLDSPYIFSLVDLDYSSIAGEMAELLGTKSLIFVNGLYYIIT